MDTWLVTGGLGFIGSHFVRAILSKLSRDQGVVVLDKKTYAAADGYRLEYYGLHEHSRLRVYEGDVRDVSLVGRIVEAHTPRYWVHLAAESHVDRSIDGALPFVETNVLGTQVLLDAAVARHIRGEELLFCLVSTDEVYGPFSGDPDEDRGFSESQPLSPTNPYAASKAAAEHLVLAAHRTHGLPVVITRGGNTLGPLQSPEKFLPRMIGLALRDGELPVYGDGRQRRQWLHVEDHVDGILSACLRGNPGAVYNLGGDACPTNLEMAESIRAIVGKGCVIHVPDRPAHDRIYKIDSSISKIILNWSPIQNDIRTMLASLVDWYRGHPGWFARNEEELLSRKGLGCWTDARV